jgi:hypothetical protein
LASEPPPPLLRSLAVASLAQGDFAAARQLGANLRARGERDADDVLLIESAYVLGIAAFWHGDFDAARAHFETAVERYRPEDRDAHLLHYGLDPKVICQSRLGNTLWFLGRPTAAQRARDDALALAAEIGHPHSHATALVFAALLSLEMGDVERMRAYASMLVGKDAEREGRPNQTSAEAIAGYVDVVDGRIAEGLSRIAWALDDTREAGHAPGIYAANARLLLAAHTATADAAAGLTAADRLLEAPGVRLWEAEARRLRAEFLAALGAAWHDIETELALARQTARRQAARALELRTLVSDLRLRRQHDDDRGMRSVHTALRALLQQMPEARDTRDYQTAASLLD